MPSRRAPDRHGNGPAPMREWHWLAAFVCLSALLMGLLAAPAIAYETSHTDHGMPAETPAASFHPSDPIPHCHHGHGRATLDLIQPRTERQEIDAELPPAESHSPPAAPISVATIGQPSAAPVSQRAPLYLLTERFRS